MKRYVCIFPGLYNYILAKDVGMIPYILSDSYKTSIVTYDNDDYTYLENMHNENFGLEFISSSGNEKSDVTRYLRGHAKDIDILQLYHLRYGLLFFYIFTYKLFNNSGHIYLKLDSNNNMIDFLVKREGFLPSLRRLYVRFLFYFTDTVSIETCRNYHALSQSGLIGEDKLLYLPNGVSEDNVSLENKEKIILYVGYVEKKNKSIDVLLDSVRNIQLNDWKVVLVGKINEDIEEYLDEYFIENPHLKDRVILKGYITDKKKLAEEYAKSSIYCCVSKQESFGISTLEAAYHGNYILSTDVGGSSDIINTTGYGKIVTHENLDKILIKTLNEWYDIKADPYNIQKRIYEKYNWKMLCSKLDKRFKE